MGKAIYQQLLDALAAMQITDDARRQFEQMIRTQAGLDDTAIQRRQERVDFARHLLGLREPRALIRDRLMVKYELGRTQAYQVIDQVLNCSVADAGNRTAPASNCSTEALP